VKFRNNSIPKLLVSLIFLVFGLTHSLQSYSQANHLSAIEQIESELRSFNTDQSLKLIDVQLRTYASSPKTAVLFKALKVEALVQANLFNESLTLSNTIISSPYLVGDFKIRVLLQRALIYEILDKFSSCQSELNAVGAIYKNPKVKKTRHFGEYLYRLSSFNRMQGRTRPALYYAQESKKFGKDNNYPNVNAVASMLLAFLEKDPYKKKSLLNEALKQWKVYGDHNGMNAMYVALAKLNITEKNYEAALKYCDSAIVSSNKLNNPYEWNSRAYFLKSQSLEKMGMEKLALHNYKIYDSINKMRIIYQEKIQITEQEFNFELEKDKILKDKVFQDNIQINKYNDRLYIFIGALVILLGAVIVLLTKILKINKKTRQQKKAIVSSNRKLSLSIKEKELLYKELHHRVKNNLSLIMSLVEFQSIEIDDPLYTEKFNTLKARIGSIAIVHNQFLADKDSVLKEEHSMEEYINKIANAVINLGVKKIIYHPFIQHIILPVEKAIPIGILVNELIANTVKHARVDHGNIIIDLEITAKDDLLLIEYKDNGIFYSNAPTNGLGTFIIESMILQLYGNHTRTGSHYKISLNIN